MSATAELFMHGRSQAVPLPKEFWLPGTEVRVTKVGSNVILERLEAPPLNIEAWWAQLHALGAANFLTASLPSDPLVQPDETIDFG